MVFLGAQNLSVLKIIEGLQSEAQDYPSPLYSFSLCMEITNRIFNDSLLNAASLSYKNMYTEVTEVVSFCFDLSMNVNTVSTNNSSHFTYSVMSVVVYLILFDLHSWTSLSAAPPVPREIATEEWRVYISGKPHLYILISVLSR